MSTAIDRTLVIRGLIGGTFMGLANLVPGISGGTMLLASGVYTRFIEAIADVTSLKFSWRAIVTLASVCGAAVLSILLLAGIVKSLVVEWRWAMYSLFIGLTLGGIPIIAKLLGKVEKNLYGWIAFGMALMIGIAIFQSGQAGASDESGSWMLMFFAGAAGASAMILPGISGGYLLLVMGAYLPILGGIDQLKTALKTTDFNLLFDVGLAVILPVGLGIGFGVVVVSHALKWLLNRFERQTYAVLLGLLVGAVFGLWPFQAPVDPSTVVMVKAQAVELINGRLTYTASGELVKLKDIPMASTWPSLMQAAGAIALIGLGLVVTLGIARFGDDKQAET